MKRIIKRTICISLLTIILLYIAYIFLLGILKGGISFDVTNLVKSYSEDSINWYFGIKSDKAGRVGTDEYNNKYLLYYHTLPEIFEDNAMIIILSLDTGKAVAYIAQMRGIEYFYGKDYPNVTWKYDGIYPNMTWKYNEF